MWKQLQEKVDDVLLHHPRPDEKELEIRGLKDQISEIGEEHEIKKNAAFIRKKKGAGVIRDD